MHRLPTTAAEPRVTDALDRHAHERPEADALVDGQVRLSWSALRACVDQAAARLRAAGVAPGHRLGLRAPDGAAALVAALSALRVGAVHVPVDHQLAGSEAEELLRVLEVDWLVEPPLDAAQASARWALARRLERAPCDPLGANASAFMRLSSGTTGEAKGVLISHAALARRIAAANQGLGLGPHDRVLWLLPMAYHVAVSILLYVEVGATVVFGNHLRAAGTAAIARAERVTMAYGSPYHVRRLGALPRGEDLPDSLACVISTTTALDAGAAGAFRARHGRGVRQALGIIEVGLPFISPGAPGEEPGALGVALPGYQSAILDPSGEALPDGVVGELALRGEGMFDAYVSPWRARASVLHHGWFRTGDSAVRAPADGAVRLLGRIKDVINVGGLKVFPLEVEAVLEAHPWVAASRVRALPDPRLGELVHAEVELRPGVARAEGQAALEAWCAERLAALKRPSRIDCVERLAKTASGKVRR